MRKMCAGALAAIMLAGCGGGGDKAAPAGTATSPVAVPSAATSKSGPMVTPNGTLDPSTQGTTNPSTDPLYLEAVKVYKAYFAEMQKVEAAGYPSDTLPPVMDQYITGQFKADVAGAIKESRRHGERLRPGQHAKLSAIGRGSDPHVVGSLVSVETCTDATAADVINKTGERVAPGALLYHEIYFKRFDGKLKAFEGEYAEVKTCPIK